MPAETARLGQLEQSEVENHPYRHVLTRVLGGGPAVQADSTTIGVADGDLLMLCTDALWKELTDQELAELRIRA